MPNYICDIKKKTFVTNYASHAWDNDCCDIKNNMVVIFPHKWEEQKATRGLQMLVVIREISTGYSMIAADKRSTDKD